MARITRAAPHLWPEELKRRRQLDARPWRRQRWLIIYNALPQKTAREAECADESLEMQMPRAPLATRRPIKRTIRTG
jgi:hypothetical protein